MAKRKEPIPPSPGVPFLRSVAVMREGIDENAFPFSIPAIAKLSSIELHPKVTFFVGENGSGKSTLLEAIAVACRFNVEGGSKATRFETAASDTSLHRHLQLVRNPRRERDGFFLRAESFFNVATLLDTLGGGVLHAYGGKSLHEQSHGEAFLALVENRFGEDSLFLMDEPEAALSPQRQLSFLVLLDELVQKARCQAILATHSPILMAYPDAWIYSFDENGLKRTALEETEHYRITKDFLAAPERFFRNLFRRD